MMRAIYGKDAELMEKVRVAMNGTFFYANGVNSRGTDLEDGYYRDGSYLLHIGLAHTGGYGTAHLENLPFLIYVLSGTGWALDQDRINIAWDWIYNTYMPVMYKGGVFDFVKDREISRAGLQSHVMGQRIASALAGLALAAPEPHKSYFQSVVKGWIQEDGVRDFFANIHQENQRLHIAATIRMEQLMRDTSIKPVTGYTMGRMFGVSARAVSFRPGYAYGVAMNCSRMKYYETIHGENLKGWYMNEGMTFFVNDADLGQYDGDYWATVNWRRLPGTTVDVIERAKQEAGSTSNHFIYSKHHWAGGVQMGDRYVATGYHMDAYNVTLTARKSWFMLDHKIIALGADINSADNRTIETIVDNRKLTTAGNNRFVVDGKEKSKELNWSETMTDVSWMWLENTGGYYFPKNTGVNALRERRTGSWGEINQSATETGDNCFLTFWIDHGKSPSGASYEYVFLPDATPDFTKNFSQKPDFEILENSEKAQGIFDKPSGVTAVNFWTDEGYTVGGITATGHASVMVWKNAGEISVAISEPTWQNNGTLRVKIDAQQKYRFGKIVSKDERITVVENTGSTVVIDVDLSGRPNGGTFTVRFAV
jgi:hyaluronate lyase